MEVVIDTETNSLRSYSRLWCIVCKELGTRKVHVFKEPDVNPEEFMHFASGVSLFIGHNVLGFDYHVLRHFFPRLRLDWRSFRDTLVFSRLVRTNILGGHSLEAWGERLGYPKDLFDDFSQYSETLVDRCKQDVEINYQVWQRELGKFDAIKRWRKAIDLEHFMALTCKEMTTNGFYFDHSRAMDVYQSIATALSEVDGLLAEAFPPKPVPLKEITPKETKHGTISLVGLKFLGPTPDLSIFKAGAPFTRIEYQTFNPRSPRQIVSRLNDAGWQPVEKTRGHLEAERSRDESKLEHYKKYGWTVSETNLATLPEDAPQAVQHLAKRLVLESRRGDLEEWLKLYDDNTRRVHGEYLPIGAWTHRMAHHSPNTANIASPLHKGKEVLWGLEGLYGADLRTLWRAAPGRCLVGVDADGIQLRVLAHCMDEKEFTTALVSGDKSLGTDAHSLNKQTLGDICRDRDTAKTFIYAWLLGAGVPRIAKILDCSVREAKEASERFLNRYPGLVALKKKTIPRDARRGYFEGLDKRLVFCDNEHKMLAGYLQCGEATIMKLALQIWKEHCDKEKVPYWLVNFVHDEWITETIPEAAEYVRQAQCAAITTAGEMLNCKCPMSGTGRIGLTWFDIH